MGADGDEHDETRDPPRIYRVNRRGFLWQVAAACAGGLSFLEDAGARRSEPTPKQSTFDSTRQKLDLFRLQVEHRPFRSRSVEVYPVLGGERSRLLALSETGWLGIWAVGEPSKPQFKGEGACCPPSSLADGGAPAVGDAAAVVSQDGAAHGAYQQKEAQLTVQYRERPPMRVALDSSRGGIEAMSLGQDGTGLAVAMGRGGVLLFDLRGAQPEFLGEYYDDNIVLEHVTPADAKSRWGFLPCVCDTVRAEGQGDSVTVSQTESSSVGRYDSVTGTVTTSSQPCGTPLPAGAVCLCNCVRGPAITVARDYCVCDKVCTCNLVSTKRCACDRVCTCDKVKSKHCSCDKVCTCNLVYF
jgi:hypothetical protein